MKSFALAMVLSVSFLIGSVVAMRRQRLREQTAMLWLSASLFMVVVSATLPAHLIDRVSLLVGVAYSPAFLLLLAVLFLMILVFHLALSLDRLSAKQIALVQEIGLLTARDPKTPDEAAADQSPEPPSEGSDRLSPRH